MVRHVLKSGRCTLHSPHPMKGFPMAQTKTAAKGKDEQPRNDDGRFTEKTGPAKTSDTSGPKAKDAGGKSQGSKAVAGSKSGKGAGSSSAKGGAKSK